MSNSYLSKPPRPEAADKWYAPTLLRSEGHKEIQPHSPNDGIVYRHGPPPYIFDGWTVHAVGSKAFRTRKEAVERAKTLRRIKIESLRKQIEKLERLGV